MPVIEDIYSLTVKGDYSKINNLIDKAIEEGLSASEIIKKAFLQQC